MKNMKAVVNKVKQNIYLNEEVIKIELVNTLTVLDITKSNRYKLELVYEFVEFSDSETFIIRKCVKNTTVSYNGYIKLRKTFFIYGTTEKID